MIDLIKTICGKVRVSRDRKTGLARRQSIRKYYDIDKPTIAQDQQESRQRALERMRRAGCDMSEVTDEVVDYIIEKRLI